jgi:acyl-CoA synthetase (NDP forming)
VLVQRAETQARPVSPPAVLGHMYPEHGRSIVAASPRGFLGQDAVAQLLDAYGIPAPRVELAHSAREALVIAEQLGFPVALKVASADIPHKSDVGGVLLGLGDAASVNEGFAAILRNARAAHPHADIRGAYVQRMLPPGQEVIVGAVQDAQFGPLVMFGSGGVEVEGLHDVAFGLGPLSHDEAAQMLDGTWAGRKLTGYRNLVAADRVAVIDVVLRLAQLATDLPAIAEIEINPLRVLAEGQGAVAVDVRIRIA